jgi:hypothetical protein
MDFPLLMLRNWRARTLSQGHLGPWPGYHFRDCLGCSSYLYTWVVFWASCPRGCIWLPFWVTRYLKTTPSSYNNFGGRCRPHVWPTRLQRTAREWARVQASLHWVLTRNDLQSTCTGQKTLPLTAHTYEAVALSETLTKHFSLMPYHQLHKMQWNINLW